MSYPDGSIETTDDVADICHNEPDRAAGMIQGMSAEIVELRDSLHTLERELTDCRARQDALISPQHSQARRLLVAAGMRNQTMHG